MDNISRRSQGTEGVRFGGLGVAFVLFADYVVLLVSSGCDLQHKLGRFAECEAAGMRVSTSKSQKLEELGDSKFEERNLSLLGLPSLKTDYFHWLHMQDWERLRGAIQGLRVFWHHLDVKRQQMEQEHKGQPRRLTRAMQRVELDVRDLIHLAKKQLIQVNHADRSLSNHQPPTEAPPPTPLFWARVTWHKRLEGYVVLRDLECYLRRLVRDFLLLKGRQSS